MGGGFGPGFGIGGFAGEFMVFGVGGGHGGVPDFGAEFASSVWQPVTANTAAENSMSVFGMNVIDFIF